MAVHMVATAPVQPIVHEHPCWVEHPYAAARTPHE
jgi:hypothetical protein